MNDGVEGWQGGSSYYKALANAAPEYMAHVRSHLEELGLRYGSQEFQDIADWVALHLYPADSLQPIDASAWCDSRFAVIQGVEAYILSNSHPNRTQEVASPDGDLTICYLTILPDNVSYMFDTTPATDCSPAMLAVSRQVVYRHAIGDEQPPSEGSIVYEASPQEQEAVAASAEHLICIGMMPLELCN